ncbi:MAG TPA: ATP-binding protein [Anaerolineales bacterium]|nr:ATP-binding protein [Anaerolineales bacterium]
MKIFKQLRWRLTLNYTLATVGTLLVITLVLGGLLLIRIFQAEAALPPGYSPTNYIDGFMNIENETSSYLYYCQTLSQTPLDLNLVNRMLAKMQSVFTQYQLFRIAQVKVTASTMAELRIAVFKPDGTLLGSSAPDDPAFRDQLGKVFDPARVPGLAQPFRAAQAGETDPNLLYTEIEKDQRYVFAAPCFNRASGDAKRLTGIIAILIDAVPTQQDVPRYLFDVAARILVVFLLFAGLMGAVFGYFFSHGLVKRFDQLSSTTDHWSEGDFSRYLNDAAGDEISQFAQRLNDMARQMQSLLRRRQDMAVSEERTRLARELHDSVTQLLYSVTLYAEATAELLATGDTEAATEDLRELRDTAQEALREMRLLIFELHRPILEQGGLISALQARLDAVERRGGMHAELLVEGSEQLQHSVQEELYNITQEALNNALKHSRANNVQIRLRFDAEKTTLEISDDGIGFEPTIERLGGGFGISGMTERAQKLGGTVEIQTAPGKGTKVIASVPVQTSQPTNHIEAGMSQKDMEG